jgi:hypothetical protein
MGQGPRLFQRYHRLDLQILLGLGPDLLLHEEKLESGLLCVCSLPDGGTGICCGLEPPTAHQEPNRALTASTFWRWPMSKEKPTDDPRQQTDWGSHKQTDRPWKGNPEKEQRPGSAKPDLKWHETNTH